VTSLIASYGADLVARHSPLTVLVRRSLEGAVIVTVVLRLPGVPPPSTKGFRERTRGIGPRVQLGKRKYLDRLEGP
jgi:hypothetical protein